MRGRQHRRCETSPRGWLFGGSQRRGGGRTIAEREGIDGGTVVPAVAAFVRREIVGVVVIVFVAARFLRGIEGGTAAGQVRMLDAVQPAVGLCADHRDRDDREQPAL